MPDPQIQLVRTALGGDPVALRDLVDALLPAIHVGIGRVLRRRVRASGQSRARHEIEDLSQEVLLALFANDGRRLRAWDREKGLSLAGYVQLVAEHLALSFLRKRARRVWEDEPVDDEERGLKHPGENPEWLVEHKDFQSAVLAAVAAALTQQGRDVFQLLVIDGLPVAEVCAATGLSPNAVYVWRSRILQRAGEAARKLRGGEPADG